MKRISLFCGHYGSGKTNIAVNYAFKLAAEGLPVAIADLDIVNPYFRTKDSEKELEAAGIKYIGLPFAGSNVDLPALPAEMYGLLERKDYYVIMDIGGDDRGAYALGRYTPMILEEGDYEMFFVANFYRPLTRTAEEALGVMAEIEAAGGIPFTAIINNSNLGPITKPETVEATRAEIEKLSALSGLPIAFTSIDASMEGRPNLPDLFTMELQKKPF
jgi:hypothetical protein